jgi:hypothetical protein
VAEITLFQVQTPVTTPSEPFRPMLLSLLCELRNWVQRLNTNPSVSVSEHPLLNQWQATLLSVLTYSAPSGKCQNRPRPSINTSLLPVIHWSLTFYITCAVDKGTNEWTTKNQFKISTFLDITPAYIVESQWMFRTNMSPTSSGRKRSKAGNRHEAGSNKNYMNGHY